MSTSRSRRARRGGARSERGGDAATPMRWQLAQAAALLVEPGVADDKYRRGVLGLRTGSAAFPGAAVLGAEAAWRTGLGILRYTPPLDDSPSALGLPSPAAAVLSARPETVFLADPAEARIPADAWVIGSGTDAALRSPAERVALQGVLAGPAPVVIDAGALDLALDPVPGDESGAAPAAAAHAPRILTPHRGEFLALWRAARLGDRPTGWPDRGRRDRMPAEAALIAATRLLAEKLGATVLLKGSTTVTATPRGLVFLAGPATPWLATAGTGDVLAGILGALLAAHATAVREDPEILGALGAAAALVHDAAARQASGEPLAASAPAGHAPPPQGRPITALEVAQALPETIGRLLLLRQEAERS